MWICKSRMWSLICSHLLASYSNRFPMLQFLLFFMKNIAYHFSFFLAFLFKFQQNSIHSFWWIKNNGKWKKRIRMIVHTHCHDKLTPLKPASPNLSLFLLRFCYLKCCAFYCHLALGPNECHPHPPSQKCVHLCLGFFFNLFILYHIN